MSRPSPYDTDLDKNPANYAQLTPLVFLDWAADVYPDRVAVIHGKRRFSWAQTAERARRLASALAARGVAAGDTVAAMLSNTPEMIEAHFGVPMTGAVLNALNTRLDADSLAFMLDHGEARVLLVDREFSGVIEKALGAVKRRPLVVDVDDPEYDGPGTRLGELEYEAFLAAASPAFARTEPRDEWQAIALSYTSGTTGDPKGVVTHHRGAHLNAVNNIVGWGMPPHAVYLWTLPMFHCNGWCFTWTMAANAGTHVCLRKVEGKRILELIREHRVTHYCGAPIVHALVVDAPEELRRGISHQVSGLIAGAPPPPSLIAAMERIGFHLTQVYGLTEVYGPAAVTAPQEAWDGLDVNARAERKGRQGVRALLQDAMTVVDPVTLQEVPADGETMGEIVFRGNIAMKGYLKNPAATAAAFAGGWFHTGDLAVRFPDGYVKIRDRAKDVIISGGENISSVEVEEVLYRHPAIAAVGVVAMPDPKWGESPCAFVELKPGAAATEQELIEHCRAQMAKYKVPKKVIFGPLPKTSTGKLQKFVLRARARSTSAIE
jgi:fatty-acyl-CoA synthase